jgi:single-stranded-DNA-specific exonuclease
VAASAPGSAVSERAFRLEPYSYAEASAVAEGLGLAEPVAVALVRRGYRTVEAASRFLEAAETHDPFEFDSMAEVVGRVRAAIAARRRITVHGDYDADGVCSTAILVSTLRRMGGECDWLIPDRLGDGYGLTEATLERLVARGTGLLLTADCGITSVAAVAGARRAGIEVIVTDHHQPDEELPDCPILHPAISGYPCEELCATGVAYKLSAALIGAPAADRDLDLVALATVADMVPLRGENRALVRRGLRAVQAARRAGIRALIAAAAIEPERLDEGDLAFRLAPRINAAGRLYRADAGVELMLTDDQARAIQIAGELDRANRERRDAERDVLAKAERERAALPPGWRDGDALVVAGEGWHPGVVGIVASRLVERHGRPVVLIGLDDEGRGRGSARSVPGYDLLAGLRACDEHLGRYGGHRAAAGLEIEARRVGAFREALCAHVAATLPPEDRIPTEVVDAVVGGESLGLEVAEQFRRLAPFGVGNPGVRLLVPSARLHDVRPMGEGDRHARFSLESGSRRALGVAFGVNGELEPAAAAAEALDLSVQLEVNHWNGAVEPRVVLGELYPGTRPLAAEAVEPDEEEWWARVEAEVERPLEEISAPAASVGPPTSLFGRMAPTKSRASGLERETVDRREGSGVAAVAALASSGEPVLVLAADAVRRRELVEHAACPARFGGGRVALAAGRLADSEAAAAVNSVLADCGVALADWARLERHPDLLTGFPHVILVDPPPFEHLDRLAHAGPGYCHLAWGEDNLALGGLAAEWWLRPVLGRVYRALRDRPDDVRSALAGDDAHPRSPEVAGRCLRVLHELRVVAWERSGAAHALSVVSSEGTDLERSQAFAAYRRRYEEGRRFLSERRQPS